MSDVVTHSYRPTEDEPYMNETQRDYFRRKLLSWREEILRGSNETLRQLKEEDNRVADMSDWASYETERNFQLRARDRERKLLSKIDDALRRIGKLDGFELDDCSAALRRVRAVKSGWELRQVERAAEMLSHVHEWMARHARVGMTELELAAEIERELRVAGHQGPIRFRAFNNELFYGSVLAGPSGAVPGSTETPIVGPGPNVAVSKGASHRRIERGEPILVDLAGAWEGYLADQTRTFSLGPLPRRLLDAYEAAREILHRVADEAMPGVTGAALYERAVELAGDLEGFMGAGDERVTFVGHGFGLEIDELPLLAKGWEEPLEAGMVFALEPKFVFPGVGAVGIENSYLVTGDGAERLTSAPEDLLEL